MRITLTDDNGTVWGSYQVDDDTLRNSSSSPEQVDEALADLESDVRAYTKALWKKSKRA